MVFEMFKVLLNVFFEICFCFNLRSYKKLIFILKKFLNEIIIMVDDDFEYFERLIEDF